MAIDKVGTRANATPGGVPACEPGTEGDRWTANPMGRGDEALAGCGDEPVPTPTLSAALGAPMARAEMSFTAA
jgi:hypothetical protein